jgi:murein DD-endopeptidase MepM/ murein hydrolase activator NlpD
MSNNKQGASANGKGYYIALVLCAVAIGISGYLYYRNTNKTDDEQPAAQVSNQQDQQSQQDVQAAATEPNGSAQVIVPGEQEEVTIPPVKRKVVAPVSGTTIAPYAVDALAYNQTARDWRTHKGVDIAAEAGTAVVAAADGTVYSVYEDDTMGMTVVIVHEGGYATYYASLAETVAVKPGDTVSAGDPIGVVGCTALLESALGDHVHFAVTCNDQSVDPGEFLADAAA